jgi:hypothetical protein
MPSWRRTTPQAPRSTWIIIGLLLLGIVVFYPALKELPFGKFLLNEDGESGPAPAKADWRVWVSKRTRLYYCPDSQEYRVVKPGEYMTEYRARRLGYRPALNVPCSESMLDQGTHSFQGMLDLPINNPETLARLAESALVRSVTSIGVSVPWR